MLTLFHHFFHHSSEDLDGESVDLQLAFENFLERAVFNIECIDILLWLFSADLTSAGLSLLFLSLILLSSADDIGLLLVVIETFGENIFYS